MKTLLAGILALLICLPAQAIDVVVNVHDVSSGNVGNRVVSVTLIQPTGPVVAGPWVISGDTVTQRTDKNGICTFQNLLTQGNYRLDIAGNPSRSFPFSASPSTIAVGGVYNIIQLIGTNNATPMFYDSSQVDALIAGAGAGGAGKVNKSGDFMTGGLTNNLGLWETLKGGGAILPYFPSGANPGWSITAWDRDTNGFGSLLDIYAGTSITGGQANFSVPIYAPAFYANGVLLGTNGGSGGIAGSVAASNVTDNGNLVISNGTVVAHSLISGTFITANNGISSGTIVASPLFLGGLFQGDGSGLTGVPVGSTNIVDNGNLLLSNSAILGHSIVSDTFITASNGIQSGSVVVSPAFSGGSFAGDGIGLFNLSGANITDSSIPQSKLAFSLLDTNAVAAIAESAVQTNNNHFTSSNQFFGDVSIFHPAIFRPADVIARNVTASRFWGYGDQITNLTLVQGTNVVIYYSNGVPVINSTASGGGGSGLQNPLTTDLLAANNGLLGAGLISGQALQLTNGTHSVGEMHFTDSDGTTDIAGYDPAAKRFYGDGGSLTNLAGNGSGFTNITDALHDADAIAYWTALGITDTDSQDRINNFFKVLKQDGLWVNLVDGAMMASDLGGGTRSMKLAYGTNSAGTATGTLGMNFQRASNTYSIWPVICSWSNSMVVDITMQTNNITGGSYAPFGLYDNGTYDLTNGQFIINADNGSQVWQGTNFSLSGSLYDPSSLQAIWADSRERVLTVTFDNAKNNNIYAEALLAGTNLPYYTTPIILTNTATKVVLGSGFYGASDYRYPCGSTVRSWLLFNTVLSSNQIVQVNIALRWLDARPENWVFLGDSQTGELDTYPAKNYPIVLHSVYGANNARMWNWGISGVEAGVVGSSLLSRLCVSPLGGRAKTGRAFILAGVNDVGGGFTGEHTYEVVTNICYAVKTNSYAADLIVQQLVNTNQVGGWTPTTYGELVNFRNLCISNPMIADRVWRRDLAFQSAEMDTNNGVTVDGLHLTPLGNTYQAQMIGTGVQVPAQALSVSPAGTGIRNINATAIAGHFSSVSFASTPSAPTSNSFWVVFGNSFGITNYMIQVVSGSMSNYWCEGTNVYAKALAP